MTASSQQRPPTRPPLSRGRGLAQHTLVEHALCPLDVRESLAPGSLHAVRYDYTDHNRNRRTATAQVACPFGLSPNDELYLYGLLALTFSQPEPSADFYATPHWCLKQLGIVDAGNQQGKRYQLFRDAIRRLAGVVYENDRFFDPVRGEHRDVAFGLLKYSLPVDVESSRAWHFVWDQQFFRFAEAIRGSFSFDFDLYRSLDAASRRLFLLLQKIFWRNDHTPAFELRQLGINTLGFSQTLRTTEVKQKLIRSAGTLLRQEIIQLPAGVRDVKGLFEKQGKGRHVVRFHRGAWFDRKPTVAQRDLADSPLVEPLRAIGFDQRTIARILKTYKPRLVQEWSDITLAAVERKIIRESPQAYFTHYIREAAEKKTTPPDWWREQQKREFLDRQQPRPRSEQGSEETAFEAYLRDQGQRAFEQVMQNLFDRLREAGQSETDARKNAEYTARIHLRRQFRDEHPEHAASAV